MAHRFHVVIVRPVDPAETDRRLRPDRTFLTVRGSRSDENEETRPPATGVM